MAATSRTISYDAVLSTTADKIHKSGAIQDAITSSNPTFKAFMENGRIKKTVVGGEQIRVPIMYQHNGTISSYSEYEQIDISPQDGITSIYLPWSQYGGAVSISGIQRFKNMGKEQVADLLKAKIKQTTAGWAETLNEHIWDVDNCLDTASHPYTGNSGKNIIPIPNWIQPHTTSSIAAQYDGMDIGHIDQSAETWWHNQIKDAGNSLTAVTMKTAMSNLSNLCSQGPGGSPDIIIMDQVTWELYEQAMQAQIRYSYGDKASAGFEELAFKSARVFWDGYVPDTETSGTNNGVLATGSALTKGSMFFINSDTFTMYVGRDHDWKPRGFQTPVDQDASVSLYLAYVQLANDNRRKNGVMFDVPLSLS